MKRHFWKLALILVGLAVLAYIAWPKYELFQCRSRQSEAKAWLKHLYEAEKYYFAHHQEYASIEMLLKEGLVKSREIHYIYETQSHDSKHFVIIAKNNNDIWSIDQTGEIKSIHNACIL
ncbi:MAG: hypothetical protein V4534_05345 [Myxococcota bacterium]